jgi:hypothetical protein
MNFSIDDLPPPLHAAVARRRCTPPLHAAVANLLVFRI